MWCKTTGKCMLTDLLGDCTDIQLGNTCRMFVQFSEVRSHMADPPTTACSNYNSCASCNTWEGCLWCGSNSTCQETGSFSCDGGAKACDNSSAVFGSLPSVAVMLVTVVASLFLSFH